jgi:hypothetical protein
MRRGWIAVEPNSSAPKGNLFALGNRGGVGGPEKYRPEFVGLARQACEAGATDLELGRLFDVSEMTINRWKLVHQEFALALRIGKEVADDRVERSLYQRALGYEIERTRTVTANGQTVTTTTTERVPGDTTAMIFWLKNRRPDRWRDKREIDAVSQVTTRMEIGPNHPVLAELSDDELVVLARFEERLLAYQALEGDGATPAPRAC